MVETLSALTFYGLAGVLLLSALMVVSARNPVHAVLFLILAFFNAAGLFLMAGAEFVALTLIIVYVGAVAVLFLFVVMMLDIDFEQFRVGFRRQLPLGLAVGSVLVAEIVWMATHWVMAPQALFSNGLLSLSGASNTHILGRLLYTHYAVLFQVAGLILLVAMIGAIVLTLRHRGDVRRQALTSQIDRPRHEVLAVRSVPSGQGVSS